MRIVLRCAFAAIVAALPFTTVSAQFPDSKEGLPIPYGSRTARQYDRRQTELNQRMAALDALADMSVLSSRRVDPEIERRVRVTANLRELHEATQKLLTAAHVPSPTAARDLDKHSEKIAKCTKQLRRDLGSKEARSLKLEAAPLPDAEDHPTRLALAADRIGLLVHELIKARDELSHVVAAAGLSETWQKIAAVEQTALGIRTALKVK